MKKILQISIPVILLIILSLPVFAAGSYRVGISGNTTIRSNDTVTYNIVIDNISGMSGGIAGIQGEITFDSNKLSYQEYASKLVSDWQLEVNRTGNKIIFVAYDNTAGDKTINSNTTIFTLTFKVSSSVNVGEKAHFSITNTTGTDGRLNAANVTGGSLNATVAAHLSTNNLLSNLSVNLAGMIPAFNKNTTSYSMSVPHDVNSVNINATPEDSKSSVSIAGNTDLKPEQENDVKITVNAENGVKRIYTIKITRERDPDKPLSDNNNLVGINIDKSILSPVFDKDITDYVVWLPYEVDSLIVSGVAIDKTANVEVIGGNNLEAGKDNDVLITVTAEDGSEKQYRIIAKRANSHELNAPDELQTESEMDSMSSVSDTTSDSDGKDDSSKSDDSNDYNNSSNGFPTASSKIPYIIVTAILAGFIGFLAGLKGTQILSKR